MDHGSSHHGHHSETHGGPSLNRLAVQASIHCLTGCGIGEVFGMVVATSLGWGNTGSILVSVILAFVGGYALTLFPLLRSGVQPGKAASVALAADTVSIVAMEIVDNVVILAIPGAMDAGLAEPLFWGSLALSLVLAFVVTVPVNRWLIGRGLGHALVHAYH
jgi:hypothetical protein